jgi:RHS repeat-associated protein
MDMKTTLYISQRNSTFDSRYKFTAKELDNETQYTYFGARYLDSDISIWLSVDPLAENTPWASPYAYCINNPIRLIDPDGRDWFENELTGEVYYNSEYRKGDEGTGGMQGDGWKWMGENGMFGKKDNNVINDNKDLATSNSFFGLYNTSGAIPDSYGQEAMFSGDNAKEFMGNMGYDHKPLIADVYSYNRDWSLPEPNGPVWMNENYERIEKVYSWKYVNKEAKGTFSVLSNYKKPRSLTSISAMSSTRETWERRKYDYSKQPVRPMTPYEKSGIQMLKYTWDIVNLFYKKK